MSKIMIEWRMCMEERRERTNNQDVVVAYQHMELLPGQLSFLLKNYSEQVKKETERHNQKISEIENGFKTKKNGIETQKRNAYSEAEAAKQTIFAQLRELKEQATNSTAEYKKAVDLLPKSRINANPAIGNGLTLVMQRIQEKQGQRNL